MLYGHGDVAVEIGAKCCATLFAFDENERREHRQVEPVVENQRRFQPAVAEEETAADLRQAVAIFGAVNSSHGASSNIRGVAQSAPDAGKM